MSSNKTTHRTTKTALVATLTLALLGCGNDAQQPAPTPPATAPTASRCEANRAEILAEFKQLVERGEVWKASLVAGRCANETKAADWADLQTQAATIDRQNTIANTKASAAERIQAIDSLRSIDNAAALEHANLYARLQKQEAQALAKRKRSEGVSIGMTSEDVVASSWGKPEKINRSDYSFGVHEQWVYGSGNYIYIKDGLVSSVQTSR